MSVYIGKDDIKGCCYDVKDPCLYNKTFSCKITAIHKKQARSQGGGGGSGGGRTTPPPPVAHP